MIIVMTGDINEYDIQVTLEQMEAMKLKLVLIQNFNETSSTDFNMDKFKAPILKYYTDDLRYNYVRIYHTGCPKPSTGGLKKWAWQIPTTLGHLVTMSPYYS